MGSFLFKCVPCGHRDRLSISDERGQAREPRVFAQAASEPVERGIHRVQKQQTPTTVRARGFETVEMDIVGDGNMTDIKKRK